MPAKKSLATNNKKRPATSVIVALIGLSGVIITAVFGLIGVILQMRKNPTPTLPPVENQTATPIDTPTLTPTAQPDWSSLFYVGIEDVCIDSLIAPDYMLPLLGSPTAKTKYAEALNSGEKNNWDIAYYNEKSGYGAIFWIESRVTGQEWIRLENTFAITIYPQPTSGNMAVMENSTRCGGAEYRAPKDGEDLISLSNDLAAYSMYINYPEADYYTLQPGEPETFIFLPDCETPGIYTVKIDIQFLYQGEQRIYAWTSPRHFVCPESFDHWGITVFGDVVEAGKYRLENSEYIYLP